MANQQAQLHNIKLATLNLNTTKYKTDVSPYEGYIEQNSPVYGDILSPFYTKKAEAPATDVFLTSDGKIYYINKEDGCLYKDGEKLLHSDWFIYKREDDTTLPTTDSPQFSDYVTLSLVSGNNSSVMNRTRSVYTSEDEGKTYTYKEISMTLPSSVSTSNYTTKLVIKGNTYYGVPVDANGKYAGGVVVESSPYPAGIPRWRFLFNNSQLQGYSIALDEESIGTLLCGLGTVDVDKPYGYYQWDNGEDGEGYNTYGLRFFLFDGTFCSIRVNQDPSRSAMHIANNRYIILNTANYYNCWDTLLDKPFHFASDWNNRAICYANAGAGIAQSSMDKYIAACTSYTSANSVGSNLSIITNPFVSTQFAQALEYQPDTYTTSRACPYCYSPDNVWIDFYRDKLRNSTYPIYVESYNNLNKVVVDTSLQDTRYTNSFYGIPSIMATFTKSYLNKSIIIDWDYSYTMTYVNGTKSVFAYSAEDELEHVSGAFVVQGQDFVIINNIIYRYYSESGQLQACVNVDNMKFIGNTPYNALFWSDTNKTFYTFTGDNLMNYLFQANEINTFYDSGYNPNTLSIYAVLDNGVYIITQEQLIRIKGSYTKVFPLNSGMALFDGNEITYFSYNPLEGYIKKPIELQTMYFGQGNNTVSVNDCVYIRLYNDGTNSVGKVYLKCSTLKQGVYNSETKVFDINENMWDKESNTLFLRYQPKYQESTGFSVSIKSDFAISELKISETPITIQNSKYNI